MASSAWISLPSLFDDKDFKAFENIIQIDNQHFMVQPSKQLSIFNTKTNAWNHQNIHHLDHISRIAYNSKCKQIYTALDGKLKVINSTQKTYPFIEHLSSKIHYSAVIIINSMCHIIGGDHGKNKFNRHYIWDCTNNSNSSSRLKQVHKFSEIKGTFSSFGLIHAQKRGELLLLGGFDNGRDRFKWRIDTIHKYSLYTQTWTKLDIKLPHKMNNFGCVITKEERYVIIMGGIGDRDVNNEIPEYDGSNLYILDLDVMKILNCDIKSPFNRACKAVIMEDEEVNISLVVGFVRDLMNKYNIDIPIDIIDLMILWHSFEFIHVINEDGKHCKINVDLIFNAIQ